MIRSTPTDVLVELVRAGELLEWVAQRYDLTLGQIVDARECQCQQAS